MKNVFAKMFAVGCFTLSSCHECDPHDNSVDNSYIEGVYRMTSWTMPLGSDFNEDGIASTNLIEEYNCLTNSQLRINADFTYTLKKFIATVPESEICLSEDITTGTWSRTGFTITTTASSGEQIEYTFEAGTSALMKVKTGAKYPYLNASDELTYPTGDVTVVFVRE